VGAFFCVQAFEGIDGKRESFRLIKKKLNYFGSSEFFRIFALALQL